MCIRDSIYTQVTENNQVVTVFFYVLTIFYVFRAETVTADQEGAPGSTASEKNI